MADLLKLKDPNYDSNRFSLRLNDSVNGEKEIKSLFQLFGVFF